MNPRLVIIIIALTAIPLTLIVRAKKKENLMLFRAYKPSEVSSLFAQTPHAIDERVAQATEDARKRIDAIIALKPENRSYENTVKAFDDLGATSNLAIAAPTIEILEMVSPDKALRDAAHAAVITIQNFVVDHIASNKALYEALQAYAQGNAAHEQLSDEQRYFLDKTIDDFKRSGLDLPEDQLEAVKKIKKELAALELDFGTNIAQEKGTITVTREGLKGLEEDFIAQLKRHDDRYVLGTDYPTYFAVMENCAVEQTRKDLMTLFENRAYPVNNQLLQQIANKRDQLARMLGFASYAAYDLSDQMVATPARAKKFITDLLAKAQLKEEQEFKQLIADLPESVTLTADKTLKPWDVMYARNQYKKKHYDVDEQKIAEYFPMEKTVEGLLAIYQEFFSVTFKKVSIAHVWHQDVWMVEIYSQQDNQLLGYFLLDLYPRDNKFSHACQITVLPATYTNDENVPAIALVIANFPQSTPTKPSLLKRKDVVTFFHEFGHALHTLFGRTHIASLSGTSVKRDFVEMPSQMLEEWLTDAMILKKVSSHYVTQQPLPDDLIKRILDLKNFGSGATVSGQLLYALLSLELFEHGENKDIHALYKKLHALCKKHIAYDPENHMYVSFGHLTGYGAKYYGYMWSKVFALDLFYEIKKHGLLDPVIGAKYKAEVLAKGGSEDPNALLKNFLGREPNQEAFLKDLGL